MAQLQWRADVSPHAQHVPIDGAHVLPTRVVRMFQLIAKAKSNLDKSTAVLNNYTTTHGVKLQKEQSSLHGHQQGDVCCIAH